MSTRRREQLAKVFVLQSRRSLAAVHSNLLTTNDNGRNYPHHTIKETVTMKTWTDGRWQVMSESSFRSSARHWGHFAEQQSALMCCPALPSRMTFCETNWPVTITDFFGVSCQASEENSNLPSYLCASSTRRRTCLIASPSSLNYV